MADFLSKLRKKGREIKGNNNKKKSPNLLGMANAYKNTVDRLGTDKKTIDPNIISSIPAATNLATNISFKANKNNKRAKKIFGGLAGVNKVAPFKKSKKSNNKHSCDGIAIKGFTKAT